MHVAMLLLALVTPSGCLSLAGGRAATKSYALLVCTGVVPQSRKNVRRSSMSRCHPDEGR